MGSTFSLGTFSLESPPFPSTGKAMTVRIQCSHTGRSVDLSVHRGHQVTSDWTSSQLMEAIEAQVGVHRRCQKLMFAGNPMEEGCTIEGITGSTKDQLPDKIALFLLVDQASFPERLGPFCLAAVNFASEDFTLPLMTQELRDHGFYWQLKNGTLEKYGLAAHSTSVTGQTSPVHVIDRASDLPMLGSIPEAAAEFAWSYPIAAWEEVQDDDVYDLNCWDCFEGSVAMKSFLSIGGYIYFDAEGRILEVTTLGRPQQEHKSEGSIEFTTAQRWEPEWTLVLAQYGRFQRVTMRALVETGAVWFCWLRPNEVLEDSDGQPQPRQPQVPNGGFVFLFHENVFSVEEKDVVLDRYFALAAVQGDQASSPEAPMFHAYSLAGISGRKSVPAAAAEADGGGSDREFSMSAHTPSDKFTMTAIRSANDWLQDDGEEPSGTAVAGAEKAQGATQYISLDDP